MSSLKHTAVCLFVVAFLTATMGAECGVNNPTLDPVGNQTPTGDDPGNPTPDLTPADSPLGVVLTTIRMHVQGRIAVGDDVLAYTAADADGLETVVDYIVPSDADVAGRGIPNAEDYDPNSFAVSGKKILLMGGPEGSHAVSVFDTTDGSLFNIPRADVFLSSIPVSNYAPGFLAVDGPYVATINQFGFAGADGRELIRVIDTSGDTPTVIKFTVNPDNDDTLTPDQIMIDEETRTVLVARFIPHKFWLYDMDDPTAAPVEFDMTGWNMQTGDTPWAYDEGRVLFIGREGNYHYAYSLDVTDANNTPEKIENTEHGAFRPVVYGDRYAVLNVGPASTGTFPNTTATNSNGDGTTICHGMLGTQPIWIVGGQDNLTGADPLQYSTDGGAWADVPDPNNPGESLNAGDVHTSQSGQYLGFKHELNDDQFLGYAILN